MRKVGAIDLNRPVWRQLLDCGPDLSGPLSTPASITTPVLARNHPAPATGRS